jgi:hypothetical protein
MNRKPIQSKNIRSIGYDKEQKILAVEFNGSADHYFIEGVYHFFSVSLSKYEGIMESTSPLAYLAEKIEQFCSCKKI